MRTSGAQRVVLAALGCALAGGCATDDPRAGGFLGGIVGVAAGRYEHDLRDRENRLASLQAEQWLLGTEERILAVEREALAVAIAVREQEADALAERTLQLEEEIRGLRRTLARAQARQAELEAETARLDETPAGVWPETEGAAAEPRRRELERLAEEAAALTEELAELERAAAEEAARRAELRAEIERLKEELARPHPRAEVYGN